MSTESAPASKPKLRWYQVSLAELLASAVTVGVSLSLLKWSPQLWPLVVLFGVVVLTEYVDHRSSPAEVADDPQKLPPTDANA